MRKRPFTHFIWGKITALVMIAAGSVPTHAQEPTGRYSPPVGLVGQPASIDSTEPRPGKASVDYIVNTEGKAADINVLSATSNSIGAYAVRTTQSLKYQPARQGGRPVPSRRMQMDFEIIVKKDRPRLYTRTIKEADRLREEGKPDKAFAKLAELEALDLEDRDRGRIALVKALIARDQGNLEEALSLIGKAQTGTEDPRGMAQILETELAWAIELRRYPEAIKAADVLEIVRPRSEVLKSVRFALAGLRDQLKNENYGGWQAASARAALGQKIGPDPRLAAVVRRDGKQSSVSLHCPGAVPIEFDFPPGRLLTLPPERTDCWFQTDSTDEPEIDLWLYREPLADVRPEPVVITFRDY